MLFEKYEIEASPSLLRFEFYSIGPKGKIKKLVAFREFDDSPGIFNIGFGDVGHNGNINDLIITNNEDSQKVLATVVSTIFKFFEKHPHSSVLAIGSTKSRTRLYRIGITNNLTEITQTFKIYGFINEKWEHFEKAKDYKAFLLKLIIKKNITFE